MILFKVAILYLLLTALSLTLGWYVHALWFWLAVLLGLNLLQSAFTGACPVTSLVKALSGEKHKDLPEA